MGIQAVQPLFRGFRTVSSINAAEAQVKAQRELLRDAEQKILLETGEAYLGVVEAQAVVELTRRNEQVFQNQLAATRDRFSVGEVTQTDVSQSEFRLQRATAARIQAEGNLVTSRAAYARLVGDMPAGMLEQPNIALSDINDLDEAVKRAETNNPMVLAAAHGRDAAKENVAYAKGNLLPEVNLVAGASRAWEQSASFPDRQDYASIMARVTVPLYRSGADYSRARAAQQTAVQQRLLIEDARRRVREAAINAWQSLNTSRAAIVSDKAGIEAAEMALKGVREEAKFGTRTTLDILDAEQELLDAKVALVRDERNEASAILRVKAAVGELTAEAQKLPVKIYDANRNYDSVRDKWAGFGEE
jgi:TolC family type I secretion outer membrane protein